MIQSRQASRTEVLRVGVSRPHLPPGGATQLGSGMDRNLRTASPRDRIRLGWFAVVLLSLF